MKTESWGRLPSARHRVIELSWRSDPLPQGEGPLLPFGLGRSYGDSCLNDGGTLLATAGLDRLIDFDARTGLVRCEAGVTLEQLIDVFLPRGFFLPVTPGTKYVTVGGALANDVHGKNHHKAGTFGRFVPRFELLRSDGSRLVCSAQENAGLYRATIGGLGLTGLVTWAEVQLQKVESGWIASESVKVRSLDEFFEVNAESEPRFDYTVAWVDCLASGRSLGRGLYTRGNFAGKEAGPPPAPGLKLRVPVDLPGFALSHPTVAAFNFAYYNRQLARVKVSPRTRIDPFFYPLDAVLEWNRIYGSRGFYQYQLVVPTDGARESIREILGLIARSGQASFLAVLKTFGSVPSPGLLSFPRPGVTLALDFPNRGQRTLDLFAQLDERVAAAGGALYPAKDARMPGHMFRLSYPRWEELLPSLDPRFSSSFWRRVNADARSRRTEAA